MATRYSKRRTDGTIGYYDSVEEMREDGPEIPPLFAYSSFFAFVGFLASLVIACIVVFGFSVGKALPIWARFASVFIVAGAGSYVIGRVGQVLVYFFFLAIAVGIIGAIVSLVWHFA